MFKKKKRAYGVRVVPKYGKDGVCYGGFEGVIIYTDGIGYNNIRIVKMVSKGNFYFAKDYKVISFKENLAHSRTSGKAKAEFLISQAKEMAQNGEKIAICSNLVRHLEELDELWERIQQEDLSRLKKMT